MKLRQFPGADFLNSDLLEDKQIIFDKYKYALRFIKVDERDEFVQEALLFNDYGFEEALQATIAYWYWIKQQQKPFYPNATLIKALSDGWTARYWKDEYLDKPEFKHPGDLFWNQAAQHLGHSLRNSAIIDIFENHDDELYIVFCSGKRSPLLSVKYNGWDWLKDYAQEQIEEKRRQEMLVNKWKSTALRELVDDR